MASELADRLKRDGRLPLGSRGAAEPDRRSGRVCQGGGKVAGAPPGVESSGTRLLHLLSGLIECVVRWLKLGHGLHAEVAASREPLVVLLG